jgi:hypothetical protein
MSDRSRDAFERALDEAGQKDWADDLAATQRPRVLTGLAFDPSSGSGGKARFGLALDWTDEPADRPAPAPKAPPPEAAKRSGDTPAEIERELGLGAPLELTELTARWRDFVWRNHPDRQPPEARARANRRVAIANALYAQARREFAKPRRPSAASGPNKRA